MSLPAAPAASRITTDIPARMDRLPWGGWHWRVVIALGITWIIDGLQVTWMGAISGVLRRPESLHFTERQIGLIDSFYLFGAVVGALGFGYLTDKLGRKKLFSVTLGVYLLGAACSAFAWNLWSFAAFLMITGAGIGGEYSAINSAIDELIPARVRGRVDLAINGTYWLGAAAGSVASLALLNPRFFGLDLGWRVGFGVGALLGLVIIFYRNHVPESPRWLLTHGRVDEAEEVVGAIEGHFEKSGVALPAATERLTIKVRDDLGFGLIARTMIRTYPSRSFLGLMLMVSQAFLFNSVFFTYALVLQKFYAVPEDQTGLYLLPFALGSFLGPILLGPWFDTIGRKPMIAATYTASAVLLIITGWLFAHGQLSAVMQTVLWSIIFFFASAAASSAYLTVSEIFPVEMRGMAIALYYAIGTLIGGVAAPYLFGSLIGTGRRMDLFYGYLVAAGLLLAAVVTTILFGVKAEGASLESISAPLSTVIADEAE